MKKAIIISIIAITIITFNEESKAQTNWELGARFGDRGSIEAAGPLAVQPGLNLLYIFMTRLLTNLMPEYLLHHISTGYLIWVKDLMDSRSFLVLELNSFLSMMYLWRWPVISV